MSKLERSSFEEDIEDTPVKLSAAPKVAAGVDGLRTLLLFFFPALGGLLFGEICTMLYFSTGTHAYCTTSSARSGNVKRRATADWQVVFTALEPGSL
jgi:hypothetical protein